jgi:hypothetical protein
MGLTETELNKAINKRYSELTDMCGAPNLTLREKHSIFDQARNEIMSVHWVNK